MAVSNKKSVDLFSRRLISEKVLSCRVDEITKQNQRQCMKGNNQICLTIGQIREDCAPQKIIRNGFFTKLRFFGSIKMSQFRLSITGRN